MSFKLGSQQLAGASSRGAAYIQQITKMQNQGQSASFLSATLSGKVARISRRNQSNHNFDGMMARSATGDNSSKEEFEKMRINAMAIKVANHQKKDAFWIEIEKRVHQMNKEEEQSVKEQLKMHIETKLQGYYDENIIDKKGWISKIFEPNEQFIETVIDIMMYCKYKIMNSISIEGVAELLSKVKISLLKIIQNQDFMKALSIQSLSTEKDIQMVPETFSHTGSPVRIDSHKDYFNPQIYLTQLTIIGNLYSQIGANIDAEECYAFYIAIHESLYGPDSLKVGQCYFLLGKFYDEKAKVIDKELIDEDINEISAETQTQQRHLIFTKAELCILKACEIYKKHLGPHHRAVGDCIYSLALLNKHQMRLAKSQQLLNEALHTYQNGIGSKNMQCAQCYEELGKLSILQQNFQEAYSHLSACLEIKRELFRYKPQHRELIQVHRLIQGLVAILESQLIQLREQKKPVNETMAKLKTRIEQAISSQATKEDEIQVMQKTVTPKYEKKEINLGEEDKQLLQEIQMAIEKKAERKLTDFLDGHQTAARQQIDRLFNRSNYQSLELSESELESISFISLILTLNSFQQQILVDTNKVDNQIPYLRADFIQSLDPLQKTLLIESKLYRKNLPCYKVIEDISEFQKYIKRNNPSLMMRTKDDDEMEQIIIDTIQSEKIQEYNIRLVKSHYKAFQTLLQSQMPMKIFLFLLDEAQKKALLEFFFVALFQDSNNQIAAQCFQMFSFHVWYFHTHDTFDCEHIKEDLSGSNFYQTLLMKLFKELQTDFFSELNPETEQKALETLSIQQLLLYKRLKISPLDASLRTTFVNSLQDSQAYLFYRSYLETHISSQPDQQQQEHMHSIEQSFLSF